MARTLRCFLPPQLSLLGVKYQNYRSIVDVSFPPIQKIFNDICMAVSSKSHWNAVYVEETTAEVLHYETLKTAAKSIEQQGILVCRGLETLQIRENIKICAAMQCGGLRNNIVLEHVEHKTPLLHMAPISA
jgi:hypothetical protein